MSYLYFLISNISGHRFSSVLESLSSSVTGEVYLQGNSSINIKNAPRSIPQGGVESATNDKCKP